MNKKVLYISYDGMLEPLGQSQVLRYLERLAKYHKIFLISFEKEEDWSDVEKREVLKASMQEAGICWKALRYHKAPSAIATTFDILQGTVIALYLCLRHKIKVVHARSYVASVIALMLKKVFSLKYIFDMRGFWPDEKVDGKAWGRDSRMYKVAKWFEKKFLLYADVVVSLTHIAVSDLKNFTYLKNVRKHYVVIPTCTDLNLFRPMNICNGKTFVLGYVGSVGTFYMFDEVLAAFKTLCEIQNNARLLIVNRGQHEFIRQRMDELKIDLERVELKSVSYGEVATEINRMDAGIFFIKPLYSKRASAPTKFGEFLGCGKPCLSNMNVGDTESILKGEGVGVVLRDFSVQEYARGMQELLTLIGDPSTQSRCVSVAKKYFSLEKGVAAYDKIYREL